MIGAVTYERTPAATKPPLHSYVYSKIVASIEKELFSIWDNLKARQSLFSIIGIFSQNFLDIFKTFDAILQINLFAKLNINLHVVYLYFLFLFDGCELSCKEIVNTSKRNTNILVLD